MKEMIKLGLVLALFAVVSCVALALVDNVTAPTIAAAKEAAAVAGMKKVFPGASDFETLAEFDVPVSKKIKVERLALAKSGGQILGAVVQVSGPTYDKATILVGVDLDRKITSIQFLSLTDTPGFGQKAKKPTFTDQFSGKTADDSFTIGSDVVAITGSTITTKGVTELVRYAAQLAADYAQDTGVK